MTDTTDTGGKMYSLAINAPQPLNITFTDGSQLIFPLSGKASFTGDVEESARVFFDAVIRHRDSQLEAERQRADKADSRLHEVSVHCANVEAELAALKGEQVPVSVGTSEECSPDVYAKGLSACLVDITKEKAEVICRGISAASGVAVDWHYIGGRVHIKAMRVTAPQKPVVLPGIGGVEPTSAPEFVNYADGWRDGINECRKAIEAAGGIVKDGE